MTLEEQKRLAERTYPGRQVEIRDGRVYVRPSSSPGKLPDMIPFFPNLDRAQAYDVIEAALKLPNVLRINCHYGHGYSIDYLVDDGLGGFVQRTKTESKVGNDILSAAIQALLQEGK